MKRLLKRALILIMLVVVAGVALLVVLFDAVTAILPDLARWL